MQIANGTKIQDMSEEKDKLQRTDKKKNVDAGGARKERGKLEGRRRNDWRENAWRRNAWSRNVWREDAWKENAWRRREEKGKNRNSVSVSESKHKKIAKNARERGVRKSRKREKNGIDCGQRIRNDGYLSEPLHLQRQISEMLSHGQSSQVHTVT
jgi:hypothetical protein